MTTEKFFAYMGLEEQEAIGDYEKVLYLLCENTRSYYQGTEKELVKKTDTVSDIKEAIATYPECEYIFIDEITKTEDFISAGSFLSDSLVAMGKKVVITGTDSLGLVFAGKDELHGRMDFLHTTFIPYKEFNRILKLDLLTYIKYGGTLTPENTFYNHDSLNEYSSSAIVNNIVNK